MEDSKIDDYILAEVKGISVVDEESKEFVDLGTSVRMKQTEEALLKSTEDAGKQDVKQFLKNFEMKWFPFLK